MCEYSVSVSVCVTDNSFIGMTFMLLQNGRSLREARGAVAPSVEKSPLNQSSGQTALPTANSSQAHNFDGVGYRLATHLAWVGSSWLEFDQAQILLCDYAVVFTISMESYDYFWNIITCIR